MGRQHGELAMTPEAVTQLGYDIHGFATGNPPLFWLALAVAWVFLYMVQTRV